jgi:hypothetical protein
MDEENLMDQIIKEEALLQFSQFMYSSDSG